MAVAPEQVDLVGEPDRGQEDGDHGGGQGHRLTAPADEAEGEDLSGADLGEAEEGPPGATAGHPEDGADHRQGERHQQDEVGDQVLAEERFDRGRAHHRDAVCRGLIRTGCGDDPAVKRGAVDGLVRRPVGRPGNAHEDGRGPAIEGDQGAVEEVDRLDVGPHLGQALRGPRQRLEQRAERGTVGGEPAAVFGREALNGARADPGQGREVPGQPLEAVEGAGVEDAVRVGGLENDQQRVAEPEQPAGRTVGDDRRVVRRHQGAPVRPELEAEEPRQHGRHRGHHDGQRHARSRRSAQPRRVPQWSKLASSWSALQVQS